VEITYYRFIVSKYSVIAIGKTNQRLIEDASVVEGLKPVCRVCRHILFNCFFQKGSRILLE
jgi:hypothetical protein